MKPADKRLPIALRRDLIERRIQLGSKSIWVVKDPISRDYFFFDDREFSILKLLDGKRTLPELLLESSERFAPAYLSAESLLHFLADARRRGLSTFHGCFERSPDDAGVQPSAASAPWWNNPFAIRLPGINPDRFLDALVAKTGFLFHPLFVVLAVALLLISSTLAIVQFDSLVGGIAETSRRLTSGPVSLSLGPTLLLGCFAVVIGLSKIAHELAHGITCKHFGGECRELGLMFLLGVPCLYCDVSDAWLIPERWKRVLISSAGILVELVIGSIAVLVWTFSLSGTVQDLAVLTIVVCSVSTIVFNGNPLMRYDGYFVLSDMLGIPNLAARASSQFKQTVSRFLGLTARAWSPHAEPSLDRDVSDHWVLALYAVCSGMYRLVVISVILMVFSRFASGAGFGLGAAMLVTAWVVAMVGRRAKSIVRGSRTLPLRYSNKKRPVLSIAAILIGTSVLLCLPLPKSIYVGVLIEPGSETDLYVSTPGYVRSVVPPGTLVEKGDPIVELSNWQTRLGFLELEGEVRELQASEQALAIQRLFDPDAAIEIPRIRERLAATKERLAVLRREVSRLIVTAPRSGKVFPAEIRRVSELQRQEEQYHWEGMPLDRQNLGGYFEEGTLVGRVGDTSLREGKVLIRQADIELVRVGQQVTLAVPGYRRGQFVGRVVGVSATPVSDVPPELVAAQWVSARQEIGHQLVPEDVHYEVRLSWIPGQAIPPSHLVAAGRIHVDGVSVIRRLRRFMAETFRFLPV